MDSENNEIYAIAAKIARPVLEQVKSQETYCFPLQRAFLCSNCDYVANISGACPKCGDETGMLSLASVVNRGDV